MLSSGSAAVVSQPAVKTEGDGQSGVTVPGVGYEKNVNMALNEIAMQNGCVPEWSLISESGPQHQKVRLRMRGLIMKIVQRFTWQLTMGQYTTTGTGHGKKIAK